MGMQLIRRTTHSLALTPAGHAALADARALIADWDAFSERHSAQGDTVRGPLKVVAPVALGQTHLIDMAARFLMDHPDVTLEWELEDDPIRFAERGCDCWIKIGTVPDDTLIVRSIGQVERLIVAAPGLLPSSLKDPKELEDVPFIALAPFEGGNLTLTNREGAVHQVSLRPRMTTNNIVSILRAVLLGAGAAIMPTWFIAKELREGHLIDALSGWRAKELSINLAFLPARNQPRRLEAFLESLRVHFQAMPGIT